jgi:hypothetical protein
VRLLLVIALVHGLAPGFAEVGEAVVHWTLTGHAPHSAEDRGDLGEQGPEHGCGTTQHRCDCCSAHPLAQTAPVAIALAGDRRGDPAAPPPRAPAPRAPPRPFRPPIS